MEKSLRYSCIKQMPPEVQLLVELCKTEMMAESDYDILAVVPDHAPEDIDSPSGFAGALVRTLTC